MKNIQQKLEVILSTEEQHDPVWWGITWHVTVCLPLVVKDDV